MEIKEDIIDDPLNDEKKLFLNNAKIFEYTLLNDFSKKVIFFGNNAKFHIDASIKTIQDKKKLYITFEVNEDWKNKKEDRLKEFEIETFQLQTTRRGCFKLKLGTQRLIKAINQINIDLKNEKIDISEQIGFYENKEIGILNEKYFIDSADIAFTKWIHPTSEMIPVFNIRLIFSSDTVTNQALLKIEKLFE